MLTEEYLSHKIFEEITEYTEFYESLSFSIYQYVTMGTTSFYNLDSYLMSSIQGTLESIKLILKDGRINDVYALTRKYDDSVIINIYEILYLDQHLSLENFIVEKINNWIHCKDKLPGYRTMIGLITNSDELKVINEMLDLDGHYKKIRKRCNDHVHYNLFHFMMLNDNKINIENRVKILDILSKDLRDIFIKHFIWLFSLKGHYMSSRDYIDCLESGITPEEDLKYYVAPFVQDKFDKIIKKYRSDLAMELKNSTFMKLE